MLRFLKRNQSVALASILEFQRLTNTIETFERSWVRSNDPSPPHIIKSERFGSSPPSPVWILKHIAKVRVDRLALFEPTSSIRTLISQAKKKTCSNAKLQSWTIYIFKAQIQLILSLQ
jgi:hypothetical protein